MEESTVVVVEVLDEVVGGTDDAVVVVVSGASLVLVAVDAGVVSTGSLPEASAQAAPISATSTTMRA